MSTKEDSTMNAAPLPLSLEAADKQQEVSDNISDIALTKSDEKEKFTVIEPAVLVVFIASTLTGAVLKNQQLYQTCVKVYGYDEELCEPMLGLTAKNETVTEIESEIQPYVAVIVSTSLVINSIIPAFLTLLSGPWSDKFGRRPALVSTFTAVLIGKVVTVILAAISLTTPFNPWIYVISSLPLALTGGVCTMMTMVICLVSDVSDDESRIGRMFFVEGAMGLGTLIGNLLSSYIHAGTGAIGVFAIGACMDLIAMLYVMFFISESLEVKHQRNQTHLREFFNFDLIKAQVNCILKHRPEYNSAIIWCIMFILICITFVTQGEAMISYYYLNTKFNVTVEEFTTFNYIGIGITMGGCSIMLILMRVVFKVPLTVIALLGLLGCFADKLIHVLAQRFWQMYLAAVCGLMAGVNAPLLQAVLGSLVAPKEIGKIYAVIAALETLSPLASIPALAAIYNTTAETYPGAFYIVDGGVYAICFTLLTIIYLMYRHSTKAMSAMQRELHVVEVEK
ncbi:tetracycline resistance protein, class C-like [Zeugodacus cucurbitae]|uniref:tetracycline resistance protein, class C-like n=1 Tax=Zeugodacus cucurbitae TaxID=28588 RepID=UPI0023D93500|nr:tetracycline resistance protein, class C-like [Zeugodacus cucurbitae]